MRGAQNAGPRVQPAEWRRRTAEDARKRQVIGILYIQRSKFSFRTTSRMQFCGDSRARSLEHPISLNKPFKEDRRLNHCAVFTLVNKLQVLRGTQACVLPLSELHNSSFIEEPVFFCEKLNKVLIYSLI
ncbi:uncharacterized protein RBU33_004345 isoform 2-T2 [Hipposideros larvatus]